MITIRVKDSGVELQLQQIAKRARDLSPAMRRIKDEILSPAAQQAWRVSGLRSRSGELRGAVTPFAGKVSAGVGLRKLGYRSLVSAKAVVHTFGRRKWASKRRVFRKKRRSKSGTVGYLMSPWGDIPARPFIPSEQAIAGRISRIEEIIVEHLNVETP